MDLRLHSCDFLFHIRILWGSEIKSKFKRENSKFESSNIFGAKIQIHIIKCDCSKISKFANFTWIKKPKLWRENSNY